MPDLTEEERTFIDTLHTAKLSISKTSKLLSGSHAAIRKYIKDPEKYGKNHGGKRNSKLSSQARRNITIHCKKGAVSASKVSKDLNIAVSCRLVCKILSKHEKIQVFQNKSEASVTVDTLKGRLGCVQKRVLWTEKTKYFCLFRRRKMEF